MEPDKTDEVITFMGVERTVSNTGTPIPLATVTAPTTIPPTLPSLPTAPLPPVFSTAPALNANTIALPFEHYDKLRRDVFEAQHATELLRRELDVARAQTDDDRLKQAIGLIEALKTIADHAVANLSPEFIRDLPAEAFEVAAHWVGRVAGATQRDSERSGVWTERMQEIYKWRDRRKARGWDDVAPMPSPPPVTPPKAEVDIDEASLRRMALARGFKMVTHTPRGPGKKKGRRKVDKSMAVDVIKKTRARRGPRG